MARWLNNINSAVNLIVDAMKIRRFGMVHTLFGQDR